MILTNTETLPGKTINQCLGVVSGSTVRAKHFGRDFLSGLKNIVGGELQAYTELLGESRDQATQRMIDQATQLGADAVVNVRFSTSSIAAGASEIYVYGTAVTLD
ncbi:MAG: YbjQ family protein [Arenicellales bacterium]